MRKNQEKPKNLNKAADGSIPLDNVVRRKVGDKIKFKGTGFLGQDIFEAKIVAIVRGKYTARMEIGHTVFLNESDICV